MLTRLERQIRKEKRDVAVLEAVLAHQPIGIGGIADETGIPEHKVRYSLRMLENDGFVEPTPQGATTPPDITDRIDGINAGVASLVDRLRDLQDAEETPG